MILPQGETGEYIIICGFLIYNTIPSYLYYGDHIFRLFKDRFDLGRNYFYIFFLVYYNLVNRHMCTVTTLADLTSVSCFAYYIKFASYNQQICINQRTNVLNLLYQEVENLLPKELFAVHNIYYSCSFLLYIIPNHCKHLVSVLRFIEAHCL